MVIVYADLAPCRVKNWTVELMQRWVIQRCCWDEHPGKVIDKDFQKPSKKAKDSVSNRSKKHHWLNL